MACSLLCRHSGADLVGASCERYSSSVLVTIQGDGLTAYDSEQKQLWSLPLGSRSTVEFQVPSVHAASERAETSGQRGSIVASIVHDRSTKNYTLCLQDLASRARAVADAPARVILPGPAHSCHLLHRKQHTSAGSGGPDTLAAAVVLADGRVGVTDVAAEPSTSQVSFLASDRPTPPRHILAAATSDTLVVAAQQAAGSPVSLRVLQLAGSGGPEGSSLTLVKSLSLPCPGAGAHAVPSGLTTSSAFALLQWSHGFATVVHGLQGGSAAPLRPNHFPLADAVGANGPSSSAPSSAATANTSTPASSRKRKNAATTEGTPGSRGAAQRPRVLCATVDDGQFVVLDLESGAALSQICYSLHDAQFGCPLSSGSVGVDAPLLSIDAAQCSVVAAGPEAAVIRLGGSLHVLHIQTKPVSLLSLVARLSVATAAAAAGSGVQDPGNKATAAGGRVVAAALASLPTPVTLDPGLLAGPAAGDAAEAEGTGAEGLPDVELQPVPATSVSRVEDICNSLVEQLAAVVPPVGGPPPQALLDSAVSYIGGRRSHGMGVPPQLPSLTARGLAGAKQWSQLGTLLTQLSAGELSSCSEVLVAVVAAQQYQLLSRLCTCLDEVEPQALVAALQHLLAPTTKANLQARQQHYAALRAAAEAAVSEAEHPSRAGSTLALAQCAAAAVDGFSYREVLLHPVLAIPIDAPAVQVALRGLSGPSVDALLGYLAKWVGKYTGGALGDAAATVALPQALLFPYYHQILEWTRITIDSHLTQLLMARTPLPALESLEAALQTALEGGKVLTKLRGALEHMHAGAPLPAAHLAVATQYTAEILDLHVR